MIDKKYIYLKLIIMEMRFKKYQKYKVTKMKKIKLKKWNILFIAEAISY